MKQILKIAFIIVLTIIMGLSTLVISFATDKTDEKEGGKYTVEFKSFGDNQKIIMPDQNGKFNLTSLTKGKFILKKDGETVEDACFKSNLFHITQ